MCISYSFKNGYIRTGIHHIDVPVNCIAFLHNTNYFPVRGWSGGAMVLGKLPVPGRPTILIRVGQGPTALAVGAGWGLFEL